MKITKKEDQRHKLNSSLLSAQKSGISNPEGLLEASKASEAETASEMTFNNISKTISNP